MSNINIQRAVAIAAAENLMARHVYYHAESHHREELTNIWVKDLSNAAFAGNWGNMTGETYWNNYVKGSDARRKEVAEELKKSRPDTAEHDFQKLLEISLHLLASPVIEAAEDGQSVKALWYTPGYIMPVVYQEHRRFSEWFWERYGADFVPEDGEWKFLNLRVAPHMMTQIDDTNWSDREPYTPDPMGNVKDYISLEEHRSEIYTQLSIPSERPPMPHPYRTFSETFSYKDKSEG